MNNELIRSSIDNVPIKISYSPHPQNEDLEPHHICSLHIHDEIELLYIEAGEFYCLAGTEELIAEKGDIIYLASRVPHATKTLAHGTYSSMLQFSTINFIETKENISKYLYRFINMGEIPSMVFKANTPENEALSHYMRLIFIESYEKNNGFESFVKAGIHGILGVLYRNSILLNADTYFNFKYVDKVLPALAYIDEKFSEQITLEELSEQLNLNAYYFCRLFKRATNSTFTEYLNFVRICKSEKLLTSTSMSVSDISLDVGFSSVSYFNRMFKRFKGCSPNEYKKIRYKRQ
ncbi:MAG: AraC family transcriptional regulator [Clostridia bacterium]|nr:AraC family transcriptional regulator [Clostridia bacterium]